MNFQKKYKYLSWQKDMLGDISRGKAISIFVREGLLPLIHANGYVLTKNTIQFEDTLASMMFEYSLNPNLIYHVSGVNLTDEMLPHYYHFCNTINYEIWDRFWKKWNSIYDDIFYYDESFGAQIECMVWECVDLKKSSTYIQYLEDSYDSDEDKEFKKEDPYILDTRNDYARY